MYCHLNFLNCAIQILTPSKVVKQISNFPGIRVSLNITSLSALVQMRLHTSAYGNHFLNSSFQLDVTVLGQIIRCLPLIILNSLKKARNAMH